MANAISANMNIPNIKPQMTAPIATVSETKEESKGLSTGAKIGIGLAAAGVIGLALFAIKKKGMSAAKEIAEHIDFKPAENIEDAVKFAKKQLGIKNFEVDDLNVANYLNEGLVNISNRFKGKAILPNHIGYMDYTATPSMIMCVCDASKLDNFKGTGKCMIVNKLFFGNIDSDINRYMKALKINNDCLMPYATAAFTRSQDNTLAKLIKNFSKDNNIPFNDKMRIFNGLRSATSNMNRFLDSPSSYLTKIFEDKEIMKILKKANIETNIEKIEKLKEQELVNYLNNMVKELDKNKLYIAFERFKDSPFATIYHEIGHFAHEANAGKEFFESARRINKGDLPELTKKFVENAEEQLTASKISTYAKSAPTEFISEAFAEIVDGRKLPDDVMELYKKYKGPMVA